jgi:fatty-acyl-CoA synthase
MDVRTVPFTLNRAARWYPDREAFVQGFGGPERRYTYAEANAETRRIARGLADLGVAKGDRVALLNDSNVEHALVHYACTRLGAVPTGLHTREAPNPLAEMVGQVGASALVFHPDYAEKVERLRDGIDGDVALVALDGLGETPEFARPLSALTPDDDADGPEVEVAPDDMAYLNFSSGTTGLPKPLVTRHGQITEMTHVEAGGATEEGRVLNAFGTGFMGWENVTLTNVAVGATTVFHSGDVEDVAELAERESLTRISLITTPWRLLLRSGELEEHDLSTVESVGVSGEPITPELYRELRETVTEAVGTGYGLTETMGSGTSLPARLIDEDTVHSVGKPGLSCDVRVVEPGSRDPEATVPDGEVGEVLVNGPSVCSAVYGDPEKTAELFHEDGWVFTGDRGYLEDGFLYLAGRSDNMIISGGINVYAERVERALERHAGVAEVAVVGTPHETWGEAVKAYVVPTDDDATADALDEWCRESDDLADYQRPREYEFAGDLPRNNPGKLDRAALRERERDGE